MLLCLLVFFFIIYTSDTLKCSERLKFKTFKIRE